MLYVGKSAGPLGTRVGSAYDQATSMTASREWMHLRKNPRSAFWQFIEKLDPTRRRIAWTNVCKMDRLGGTRPPSPREWRSVEAPCVDALVEEMTSLRPNITIFATGADYRSSVLAILDRLGFRNERLGFDDGVSRLFVESGNSIALMTRHPQGWRTAERQHVLDLVQRRFGI